VRIEQAPATPASLATVVRLRRDAAAWLQARGQDQWVNDFPDTATVLAGFERDLQVLAAITINRRTNPGLWTSDEESTALFVHRLTLARGMTGRGVGAQLLDFASGKAEQAGLLWLRLDAWTTNEQLHRYYLRQGFRLVRIVADHFSPSAACFERPAAYRGAH
jgi:GNAT superfamily N-acetyltransferase